MQKFKVGMVVRIRSDIPIREKLNCSASWIYEMDGAYGKSGTIVEIIETNRGKQIRIRILGIGSWVYDPKWIERLCRLNRRKA